MMNIRYHPVHYHNNPIISFCKTISYQTNVPCMCKELYLTIKKEVVWVSIEVNHEKCGTKNVITYLLKNTNYTQNFFCSIGIGKVISSKFIYDILGYCMGK